MVQQITFSSSGYGNVAHMYPFSSWGYATNNVIAIPDSLEELGNTRFSSHMSLFDAQIKALDKRGMAIQTTLTGGQVESDGFKWVLDKFVEHDFKPVYAHVNPNTRRTIHTFMRVPRVTGKLNVNNRQWSDALFAEKNARNAEGFSYGGDEGWIFSHSGGCCGWQQVRQIPFSPRGPEGTHNKMLRMMGELLYYSAGRSTCTQLFIDEAELFLMDNHNTYNGYLEYAGFHQAMSFTSRIDGRRIVWMVRYKGEHRDILKLPSKKKVEASMTEAEAVTLADQYTF